MKFLVPLLLFSVVGTRALHHAKFLRSYRWSPTLLLSTTSKNSNNADNAGIRLLVDIGAAAVLWKTTNVEMVGSSDGVSKKKVRRASEPVSDWLQKYLPEKIHFASPLDVSTSGLIVCFRDEHLLASYKEAVLELGFEAIVAPPSASEHALVKISTNCTSSLPLVQHVVVEKNSKMLALTSIVLKKDTPSLPLLQLQPYLLQSTPVKFTKIIKRQRLLIDRLVAVAAAPTNLHTDFRGINIKVPISALSPRKSSEVLVEEVLDILKSVRRSTPLRVLDLGCGPGALILAIIKEAQKANIDVRGIGVDIDTNALNFAHQNAADAGVNTLVDFVAADFSLLHEVEIGRNDFDVVLCNPPFLSEAAAQGRVTNEGILALVGGVTGIEQYAAIFNSLNKLRSTVGPLVFQVPGGERGWERVKQVATLHNWALLKVRKDERGLKRVCVFKRNNLP